MIAPLAAVDFDQPGLLQQEVVRRGPDKPAVAVVQELDVLAWNAAGMRGPKNSKGAILGTALLLSGSKTSGQEEFGACSLPREKRAL